MKYLKKEPKKNTGLVIAVVVLSIAVMVLLALLLWPEWLAQDATKEIKPTAQATDATVESIAEAEEPQASETIAPEPEFMTIDTPYCTLSFPGEWAEQATASVNEYEGGCTVVFSSKVEDKEAYLFVILMEEGENQGSAIGSVTNEAGKTAWVYVEMNEIHNDETWTQEQMDELLAMQEGLNDLLKALKGDAEFTAAG